MEKRKGNSGGKKKKSSYKLKRSFTRNKKIRTDSPDGFKTYKKDAAGRGSEFETDKPKRKIHPGHFDKDKREEHKEKRSDRKEQFARKGRKPFGKDKDPGGDRGFKKEKSFGGDERKSKPGWDKREKDGFKKEKSFDGGERKSKPHWEKRDTDSFKKEKSFDGGERKSKPHWDKKEKSFDRDDKKPFGSRNDKGDFRPYKKERPAYKKDFSKKPPAKEKETFAQKGLIRLNRYIANAGVCSRREADDLIASGCVSVNGKIITELGYKVKEGDDVNYSGQRLKTEKHAYVLLNKPKDYITTAEDERGRRTVMELIKGACKERVYPVGRLDRNTMGLLLFTNDGEMTKKLTHPKHRVQKLYHVELDKNLKQTDLEKIQTGIELEDGIIIPDEVSYAGESKREVGILIHSGRNRIVRRIFEHLGYEVLRLDRLMFAGLTKKELPRGRWRLLTEKEISFLKMI